VVRVGASRPCKVLWVGCLGGVRRGHRPQMGGRAYLRVITESGYASDARDKHVEEYFEDSGIRGLSGPAPLQGFDMRDGGKIRAFVPSCLHAFVSAWPQPKRNLGKGRKTLRCIEIGTRRRGCR
jgi:hypothetical protein